MPERIAMRRRTGLEASGRRPCPPGQPAVEEPPARRGGSAALVITALAILMVMMVAL